VRYRCSFRKDKRTGLTTLMVEADDPYSAAVKAANRNREEDFSAVEVFLGTDHVLTWLRPADDPTRSH
jgi:hypothetical protein